MNVKGIKIFTIVLCVVFTVVGAGLATHHYSSYLSAEMGLLEKEAELAAKQEKLRMVKDSLKRFDEEKAAFQALLFNERDIPSFLDGIADFGKKTKVNILDMKTKRFTVVRQSSEVSAARSVASRRHQQRQQEQQDKPSVERVFTLASMPIDFKVEGAFAGIVNFLNYIESYEQLLSITNVRMKVTREYPILQCTFNLKIYSLTTLDQLDKE